jgi:hypothetical protein
MARSMMILSLHQRALQMETEKKKAQADGGEAAPAAPSPTRELPLRALG